MVYDCFIFNDELDLLELRLQFLYPVVDQFVLVESARSLSGEPKTLHFTNNQQRYAPFLDKIIHIVAPANELPAWEYESFQRNAIKLGLTQCNDQDIIFISDVDEIVNIEAILATGKTFPALIELPMYYYFFNLKTNATFHVNLVAPWSFIREQDIGQRYNGYPQLTGNRIAVHDTNTGWHFSYLYGFAIKKYQEKIASFSHQEFNTPFYLDSNRIARCIELGIDLFERPAMDLRVDSTGLRPILPAIQSSPLSNLFYDPAMRKSTLKNFLFTLHRKHYRRAKHKLQQLFRPKSNPATK